MSKKDKEIFDSYASGNPNQRFDLIYKNYHTFPKLIDSFETGVFNMILNEREYNRIVGGNMQRKILGKIILIVIGILFIVVTIFFVMSHKKEMIIEKANKAGLNVEFSGPKIFFIKEGSVTYCYDLEISGVKFNKYDISVEESGVKVKEGNLIVSIKRHKHENEIQGSYDDSRKVITDDGTEKALFSSMFFVCNDNFDRASLVTKGWIDAEQKAIDAYEIVTGYVPIEELKQYYKRAMDICDQLNG